MKKKSLKDLARISKEHLMDQAFLTTIIGGGCGATSASIIASEVDGYGTNTCGRTNVWPNETDHTSDPDTENDEVIFYVLE